MAGAAAGQTAWVRLPEGEARARLRNVPVIRLATADAGGQPHLVVATFAVESGAGRAGGGCAGSGCTGGGCAGEGDRIYTAIDSKPKDSRNLKRLRNITENPRVAVLADHYEDDWGKLWWVRADGYATVIEDPAGMAGPIRLLAGRYEQYRRDPPDGPVIAISVERWTGWAFR